MESIHDKQTLHEVDIIQIRHIKFEEVQNNNEKQSESIESELEERQMFEDSYYLEISLGRKVIMDYKCNGSTECNTTASAQASSLVNIKLPTIQLSKFDGKTDACSKENIVWKFIPPYTPHFYPSGLWEAGVKSCKYHLKRVLGNASIRRVKHDTRTN